MQGQIRKCGHEEVFHEAPFSIHNERNGKTMKPSLGEHDVVVVAFTSTGSPVVKYRLTLGVAMLANHQT